MRGEAVGGRCRQMSLRIEVPAECRSKKVHSKLHDPKCTFGCTDVRNTFFFSVSSSIFFSYIQPNKVISLSQNGLWLTDRETEKGQQDRDLAPLSRLCRQYETYSANNVLDLVVHLPSATRERTMIHINWQTDLHTLVYQTVEEKHLCTFQ